MIIAVLKEDEITAPKPISQGLTAFLPLTSWLPWSWPWAQHPSREKESSTLYFGLRGRVCKEAGLSKCSCLEKGSFCGLGVEWEQIQWQSRSGKLIKLIIQTSKHQEWECGETDEFLLHSRLHLPLVLMELVQSADGSRSGGGHGNGNKSLKRNWNMRDYWGRSFSVGLWCLWNSIKFSEVVGNPSFGVPWRE